MKPLHNFAALLTAAKELAPLPLGVVNAAESSVLEGVIKVTKAGLIAPLLIGEEKSIQRQWEAFPSPPDMQVIAPAAGESAADCGVRLVQEERVAALMKGALHTDDFLRPILNHLRTGTRLSHVFVVELKTYHKLLYVSDAVINVAPDLRAKAAIVENVVRLVRLLGTVTPKVAALSSVEAVNPAIPSTIDAACLSKMAQRGQIQHAVIDGPLAFDNAISREATTAQYTDSPVAGDVDIVLAPDLDTGHILATELEYLARATLGGIVLGARVPVILPSRLDPLGTILLSTALASFVYHASASDSSLTMAGMQW